MNLELYNNKGKKAKHKVKLDPEVFDVKVNEALLSQAVYVYLQNQRQATAHTKDRSDVRGGGKKPWRQKGTGRARHGSIRSPIFRGGGVTFGPSNERNYKKKLNKKARILAIRNALTLKNFQKEIIVIDDFKPAKTKELISVLKNLGIDGKIIFVQVEEEGLHRTAKNVQAVDVVRVGEMNAFDILNNKKLVILKSALEKISKNWGKKQ